MRIMLAAAARYILKYVVLRRERRPQSHKSKKVFLTVTIKKVLLGNYLNRIFTTYNLHK